VIRSWGGWGLVGAKRWLAMESGMGELRYLLTAD